MTVQRSPRPIAALVLAAISLFIVPTPAAAEDPPPSIHRAVRDDNTLAIRQWLARDMDLLNVRDADGMTPLHVAIAKNKMRAFDFLIASGANIHMVTGPSLMKIDRDDGTVAFRTTRGQWTPLHLAAFANRLQMAKVLISKGARVGIRNDLGETSLFLAAKEGHVGMIRLLIGHGADINETPRKGGFSPLMAATFNGHLEAGQMLVANGAVPDMLSAAGLGLVTQVNEALKEDPSLAVGDGGAAKSPLYWAALNGQFRIAQILLDHGAKTEVTDEELRTPLMVASMMGHSTVARLLCSRGAQVNEWDRRGRTALHHAALANQPRVVRTLIAHKADVNAKDLRGRTAADLARDKGHIDVMEVILEESNATAGSSKATLTRGE